MKESCYLFCFYFNILLLFKKKKKLASQAYGFNFARKKKDPKEKSNKKPNWPKLSWWANRGQFPLCGLRPSLTLSKPGGTSSDFNPAPFGSAVSLSCLSLHWHQPGHKISNITLPSYQRAPSSCLWELFCPAASSCLWPDPCCLFMRAWNYFQAPGANLERDMSIYLHFHAYNYLIAFLSSCKPEVCHLRAV